MERIYPHFIGEYALIKVIDGKKMIDIHALKESSRMLLTNKDKVLFLTNKKKALQFKIFEMSSPFAENPNHLLYGTKNEYEPPMYYSGDTMINNSFPVVFADNYFVKIK